MDERLKVIVSVVGGLIATFCDKYGIMIALVVFAIVFDTVTGLLKAKISGGLSSEIGTKGFFKKVALLVALFFGFFLDYAIPYMCSTASINIPFSTPFGLMICFYIILNECISVCENLYACGFHIPKWIVDRLKLARTQIEEGEQNEDADKE